MPHRLVRLIRVILAVVVAMAASVAVAAPASAHGLSGETDARLAQTIGGTELTVVIRNSTHLPAALNVDVIAHSPVRDARLELEVRSLEGGRPSLDVVRLNAGRPGTYLAVLAADRVGPHELELRIGDERSVLPFLVLLPGSPLWEVIVYGAFACAAVCLIAAFVSAALSRRITSVVFGSGMLIAITVALTTALFSSQFTPARPEGAAPGPDPASLAASGRPNAQLALDVRPERPAVGEEFVLRIRLYDGSTGQPVDDLVEHHAALVHLVVTSSDGEYFRHVHPTRTAPGNYQVRLRAEEPGRHFAYAEFERADAGGQLASGEFTVDGQTDGTTATVSKHDQPISLTTDPVVGRPIGIEFDARADDLQPWLGMAGHLLVRSEDGEYLGHVHEQNSMTTTPGQRPDESVAAYGPKLRFTFSFPEPGRYFVWIQYARDFDIITVPTVIDVAADGGRG